MNKLSTTAAAAAIILTGLLGVASQAQAGDGHPDQYTTLDHPARACHLSRAAVANWGETSAHLPQACSYGPAN